MHAPISSEDLMRYLDGELSPPDRARIDAELVKSTELQREVALFQTLKSDLRELSLPVGPHGSSVWDQVNARVNRPMGWALLVAGLFIWATYGTYVFVTSSVSPWEKLGTGAVAIGMLMLLASVILQRFREWGSDPYKDVQR